MILLLFYALCGPMLLLFGDFETLFSVCDRVGSYMMLLAWYSCNSLFSSWWKMSKLLFMWYQMAYFCILYSISLWTILDHGWFKYWVDLWLTWLVYWLDLKIFILVDCEYYILISYTFMKYYYQLENTSFSDRKCDIFKNSLRCMCRRGVIDIGLILIIALYMGDEPHMGLTLGAQLVRYIMCNNPISLLYIMHILCCISFLIWHLSICASFSYLYLVYVYIVELLVKMV